MAKWNEYGLKTGTSARDEVLILDSDTSTNKRITVGDIQEFANGKMLEKENSTLSTEAKTLIGAINEVDAKNDAQDASLEAIEKKFSDYVKKTDVDSTLLVAGSPADAKVVGERFKSNEKAIEELADKKITKFYASNQGNTHLPDSDKGKIQDMFLYGKSEQAQYKGKNLLNGNILNETKNGITIKTNADGTYVLNGTATDDAIFLVKGSIRKNFEKYEQLKLIGFDKKNPFKDMRLQCYVKGVPLYYDRGDGIIIQKMETDDNNIAIYVYKGSTLTNVIFKPMLTSDLSATIDDFEPYVGGIPSPNPDYPQEIKAVVNPKVLVRGKNLLKVTKNIKIVNGVTFTINQDGTIKVKGTSSDVYSRTFIDLVMFSDFLKVGEKYTFSIDSTDKGIMLYALYSQDNQNTWKSLFSPITDKATVTIPSYTHILMRCAVNNNITVDGIAKIQIEQGEIATPYEPYTEQSVTLPYTLNAIPVSTGGNVTIGGQQYVADYVDVERGKLVRMCKEIDFTKVSPSADSSKLSVSKEVRYNYKSNNLKVIAESTTVKDGSGYITASSLVTYSTWDRDVVGIWANGQGHSEYIAIRIPIDTDAIDYFTSIGGCKGLFQIGTPEEIDLTPEQIQAYKSLSTNYPVTNIEVSSEQLDGYTIFNYPISMAEGWNYVKQQIGDTRDYIYDMDLQSAEAYVNSEYAVALAELEVM